MKKIHCRMCKSQKLETFLDLGFTSLADNFLKKNELDKPEIFYPLRVNICTECGLSQLNYVVSPELMFNEKYPYDSSTTKTGRVHFTLMAAELCEKFNLKKNSLVIDVGSNSGVLLSGFKFKNMQVLGIEPSSKLAKIASEKGIETIQEFFSFHLAEKIVNDKGKCNIITATNVFAHIDDLVDFVKSCDVLLNDDGILCIEAPYFVNLIENLEYDTIYHEHLSYISVKPMMRFFKRFNMELFNVEYKKIHGGTLRYYICKAGKHEISQNVSKYISKENNLKIHSINRLKKFAKLVQEQRHQLISLLIELKKQGKTIAAISAPAKGNTLLNYCKIDSKILDFVTEKNPIKLDTFTPGMHIPVYSDKFLLEKKPDYAVILAWNFAEEIMDNNKEYRKLGGKFIIPIPTPKII